MTKPVVLSDDLRARDATIGARFSRQAAAAPERPAVISDEGTVTYGELEAKACRMAAGLEAHRAEPDEPFVFILPESPVLYAAMLAAAKLGRIFVPLDPAAPEGFLAEIVEISGARHVLAEPAMQELAVRVAAGKATVLDAAALETCNATGAALPAVPGDALFCVLYTSGSTGRPKAIALTQECLLHRALVRGKHSMIGAGDRVAHLRASVFAGGMHDLLTVLLNGATLCPYNVKKRGLPNLAAWLREKAITGLSFSSSTLRAWLDLLPLGARLPDLRFVVAASEPLHGADVCRLGRHLQGDWFVVHQLSSTETGTIANRKYGPRSRMDDTALPVGRVVDDFEIWIEDESGNRASTGETGEIVVRSRYLARGYWKDPEQTRAKFAVDTADPSLTVYRTGDLGRWRGDGDLEFFGRKDHRIKLRGYSIGLNEVERGLLRLPGVREAAVIVDSSTDNKRLIAYIASNHHAVADPKALRKQLFSLLPAYMVPSQIVVLASLPLTVRGKVDRKALPPPPNPSASRAPATEIEQRLVQMWREVLKSPEMGVEDDFFVNGGDSLKATQLILDIEQAFGVVLSAETMFGSASTVAGMAREIEQAKSGARATAKKPGPNQAIDIDFAQFTPAAAAKRDGQVFYVDPRTALRRAKPNASFNRVFFNAQGYRNPEIALPKPANTLRLAFLGGSTTCDTSVGNDAAWPHLTCENLKAAFPGEAIDYVNAGLPGFNTRQLLVLFKEYIAALDSDAVVIWVSDIKANSNYLARQRGLYHGAHFRPSWLAKRSHAFYVLEKNLTIAARLLLAQYARGKLAFSPTELTSDYEDRLEQLVTLCKERCPLVVLLTTAGRLRRSQSKLNQMRAAVTNLFYMPYMSIQDLLDAFDAVDDAIRRVAERTGAIVFDPADAVPGDGAHYIDSGHFLEPGSRRMADFVAKSLMNSAAFLGLLAKRRVRKPRSAMPGMARAS